METISIIVLHARLTTVNSAVLKLLLNLKALTNNNNSDQHIMLHHLVKLLNNLVSQEKKDFKRRQMFQFKSNKLQLKFNSNSIQLSMPQWSLKIQTDTPLWMFLRPMLQFQMKEWELHNEKLKFKNWSNKFKRVIF